VAVEEGRHEPVEDEIVHLPGFSIQSSDQTHRTQIAEEDAQRTVETVWAMSVDGLWW
jgi:hypothetical protein